MMSLPSSSGMASRVAAPIVFRGTAALRSPKIAVWKSAGMMGRFFGKRQLKGISSV